MNLQARVIGPETDLGHFTTLTYFGNEIGREWSPVNLTAAQIRKAEGNPYIELKGQAAKVVDQQQQSDDEIEAGLIRERLAELGVTVSQKAILPTLRAKLDEAEKAEAKRLEDEAEVQAKAQAEAEAAAQA